MVAFCGFVILVGTIEFLQFTLCYDLSISLVLVVLFVVFLVLSKHTLRERKERSTYRP